MQGEGEVYETKVRVKRSHVSLQPIVRLAGLLTPKSGRFHRCETSTPGTTKSSRDRPPRFIALPPFTSFDLGRNLQPSHTRSLLYVLFYA